ELLDRRVLRAGGGELRHRDLDRIADDHVIDEMLLREGRDIAAGGRRRLRSGGRSGERGENGGERHAGGAREADGFHGTSCTSNDNEAEPRTRVRCVDAVAQSRRASGNAAVTAKHAPCATRFAWRMALSRNHNENTAMS